MAVQILTLSLALVMSRSTWCLSDSARDWCSLTCFSFTSALLERMRMGMFQTANCRICFIQISIELKEDLSVTEQTSRIPMADRQQDGVRERNLSCPAVSHTCMSTFLSLMLMILSPQSRPTVGSSFSLKVFWLNCRRMEVLPTLLSPMRMYLTISSQGRLFMQAIIYRVVHSMMTQSQRGKQIKDYVLGETLVNYNDMHLLEGQRAKGDEVTVLMIEKKCMQQETFLPYNNLLAENKLSIHPNYVEVIQSANNIYIVVEKITKIPAGFCWGQLLPGLVELYRRMGEFKLQESEVFVTAQGRVVYMPFYKRMQMTSKFYAQFHNKSVLGDLFSKLLPLPNKNIALDIFIRNIDNPKAVEIITSEVSREIQAESGGSSPENGLYPTVSFQDEEEDDDQAIMQLMSKVKVNSDMKKEAGEQFLRLSAKREEQKEDKQIKNIIQNVESSMFKMAPIKRSTDRSKMDKLSDSKMQAEEQKSEQNSFELYFKSYFQSLRFLKKSIKEFLSYYKNSFAGIISSFLLALIVTLRKAYFIRQLQSRNDIFELQIDMRTIPINKYVAFLKRDMKSEARMVCEFKSVIENCSMPMKTYSILAPYLEDDISLVDFQQLHTFAFFFLSALLKNKDPRHVHFLHVVDCMYILLHRNYEIVFFQTEFPRQWDQKYWDEKIALIQSLVPSWTL